MAVIEKKPDIRELVGIAVNTSALITRAAETSLDRVAAMGAAALAVSLGADHQGVPVYAAKCVTRDERNWPIVGKVDERDRIAADLGQMLWHIRFGGQHDLLAPAVRLFSRWLLYRKPFADCVSVERSELLHRFSARVIHESLSHRCVACAGSGKLERTSTGRWVKPRGSMQRNATFRSCTACHGSGRAKVSQVERRVWLQITEETFRAERWGHRFDAASAWLRYWIEGRLRKPLTTQLARRIKRD